MQGNVYRRSRYVAYRERCLSVEIASITNCTHTGGSGFLTYAARTTADNSNNPQLVMRDIIISNVVPTTPNIDITGTIKFSFEMYDSKMIGALTALNSHVYISNQKSVIMNNIESNYGNYLLSINAAATDSIVNVSDIIVNNVNIYAFNVMSGVTSGCTELKRISITGKLSTSRGIRLSTVKNATLSNITMNGPGSGLLAVSYFAPNGELTLDDIRAIGLAHGNAAADTTHLYFINIEGTAGGYSKITMSNVYLEHTNSINPVQDALYPQYLMSMVNVRDVTLTNVHALRGIGALYMTSSSSSTTNGIVSMHDVHVIDNRRQTNVYLWNLNGVVSSGTVAGTIFVMTDIESRIASAGTYGVLATLVPHFSVVNFGNLNFTDNVIGNGSRVLYSSTSSWANSYITRIVLQNMLCSPGGATEYPLFTVGAGVTSGTLRITDIDTLCTNNVMSANRPWNVRGGNDVLISNLSNIGGQGFLTYSSAGTESAHVIVRDIITTDMYGISNNIYTMSFSGLGASDLKTTFEVYNVDIRAYAVSSMSTHFSFVNYRMYLYFSLSVISRQCQHS